MSGGMFSAAWHRIAKSKAKLNPNAEVERHRYRGNTWFIIRDPLSNSFFRLSPVAYRFVARLSREKTVEEVWKECLVLFPEEAPGQREVVKLLGQLTNANLIQSDLPPDATMQFERQRKQKQQELKGKLMSFLFLKFPLFDPHNVLSAMLPFFRPFFGTFGFVLWSVVLIYALVEAAGNFSALLDQTQGLLSPGNIFYLYVAGTVAKLWHEMGHGLLCRFFGGEVRTLGAMLLIMTPLPYIDASSSWSFPNRWHRILVAAGGMIFEFFLAAIALIIWANTSPGLINAIAYNTIIVASITTFLFNINPLLKFDGYFILCDIIGIPNLGQRSQKMIKYFAERYLYAVRQTENPSESTREGGWLATYGITSALYRVFLMYSISMMLVGNFFGIGIVLAIAIIILWAVVPIGKFIYYLFTDPVLEPTRSRAIAISLGGIGLIIAFLAIIPMPEHFRAQSIIEAENYTNIFTETEGTLIEIVTPPGSRVRQGDVLFRLSNNDFDREIDIAQSKFRSARISLQQLSYAERARLAAVQAEIEAARELIQTYQDFKDKLTVRAPMDGIWVAADIDRYLGSYIRRGVSLGQVIDPQSFRVLGVVAQEGASYLFDRPLKSGEIKLYGNAGEELQAKNFQLIPAEQTQLPSPALSWKSGGEIQTDEKDPHGIKAVEPFFLMTGELSSPENKALFHHRRGVMRVHVGYRPLLWQWSRLLKQILEARLKG
jgi:putative peptide zinc metalloprotease protein